MLERLLQSYKYNFELSKKYEESNETELYNYYKGKADVLRGILKIEFNRGV